MRFSLHFLVSLFFCLLFFLQLVRSFTVTCEAGGPYGVGSVLLIAGNVSGDVSNSSNITVNISKSGTLKATQSTTSDSGGSYYTIFTQSFDIGSYIVNVSASNSTHTFQCNDTFDIILQEPITTCVQKTVTVRGRPMYTSGNLVNSGTVFVSIENMTVTNTTNFSGGSFSISLTTCLYIGRKYFLYLSIIDPQERKGTTCILFIPT